MHYHRLHVLSVLFPVLLAYPAMQTELPWGDIRVMHTWHTVPANWESLGPPPAGTTIDLHIALEPQHENALIGALDEVSNPRHPKYGRHLSREEVAELVAPHEDTLKIVHSWLEHHGVPSSSISTSHGGGWLTITGVPVSQADELLSASYQVYRHTGTNGTEAILRTVSYALPAVLHAHVQTVAPTTHFASPLTPPLRTPLKSSSEEAAVMVNATSGRLVKVVSEYDGIVTPSFVRWLYNTHTYEPTATDENALGTFGFLNDYPIQADLTQFMTSFRADAEDATFAVVRVNGGGNELILHGAEGNLQTQYAEAIAYPTPYIFYSTGGQMRRLVDDQPAPGDVYLEWFNYILTRPKGGIPQTISISYGNPEREYPLDYARALCKLFARLGARGVSVLAASGNDGVGRGDCLNEVRNVRFMPMFPASCPWVTSVGGTTGFDPEVAAVFSGGGFSQYFPRHKHQEDAVIPFLRSIGKKYEFLYRFGGRGIPDVSAQAQKFVYIRDAVPYITGGTICSTSIVAGIVSLLNDHLISSERSPLGFLNPWLYSHGLESLYDVTSGSNPGCNTDGFTATAGWDPVTGLGTMDLEILQHVLDNQVDDDDWD